MLEGEVNENRRGLARRIPILGTAISAIIGTLSGLLLNLPWLAATGLASAAVLFMLYRKRPKRRQLLADLSLLVCLCSAFHLWAWIDEHPPEKTHLINLTKGNEQVELTGIVSAEPVAFPSWDGSRTNLFVPVATESISLLTRSTKARGGVQAAFFDLTPTLQYGDRIKLTGTLERRDGPGPLLGRSRHRLRATAVNVIEQDQGNPIFSTSYRLRQAASHLLGIGLENAPDTRGVLRAMLLGYRQELPREWSLRFARTGTLHVFAISGLHVGILAAILLFALRWLGVGRSRTIYFLLPILLLFVVTTGLKASAIRATLMLGLYWLAPAIQRPTDSRAALALAALVILVSAPHQVLSLGFLFSFIVVAGIIALYPVVFAPFRRLGLPDPYALPDHGLAARGKRRIASHVGSLAAMSIAAWLVSMPLTAYVFNLFSPGGLIGNLAVVPAATFIVWTGLFTLVLGIFSETLAAFGNQLNHAVVTILLGAIDGLDRLPFSHQYVPSPPLTLVIVYYLALLAVTIRRLRRHWIPVALGALVLGFGARMLWNARAPSLDFLTLDRGQAELLNLPGADVLIDTGPAHRAYTLRTHLQSQGINRIRTLILTHADANHVGGTSELLQGWHPKEVWIPDTPKSSAAMRLALAAIETKKIPIRRLAQGDRGTWPGGLTWECLHPPADHAPARADDHSIVLRISRGPEAVLLSGGMGSDLEKQMPRTSTTRVLHLGNQAGAGTAEWIRKSHAEVVVVPGAVYRHDGNPDRALLNRIIDIGSEPLNLDGLEQVLRLDLRRRRWLQVP